MTLQEHMQKLESFRLKLRAKAPEIVLKQAITGVSKVKNRSIEDGIFKDGKDGTYAKYSDKEIPTWFFFSKALNNSGRRYVKQNKYGTWHDFRKAQGLESDNVNLAYSNRMWTAYRPTEQVEYKPNIFRVIVDASDSEERKKMMYNKARYGAFYKPTQEEISELTMIAQNEIRTLVIQTLQE